MSKQTAINEISELLAYLESDRPEDNLELANQFVEVVERNLTQDAPDICICGHSKNSHFARKPRTCDWCDCSGYKCG